MATNSGGRGPRKGVDSLVEVNEVRDVRRRLGDLLNKLKLCVLSGGKAGGQTVTGGTAPGEDLILKATSATAQGHVRIVSQGTNDATFGLLAGAYFDNEDKTAAAKAGWVFRAFDDGGAPRHGAAIQFAKAAAWVGGSGNYPGELSFWVRPAGGDEVKTMQLTTALAASQAVATDANLNLVSIAGLTTTVGYVKSGGGNGTLTFTNGILTGSV